MTLWKTSIICKLGDNVFIVSCAVQDLTLLLIYVVLLPAIGVKVVVLSKYHCV